MGMESFLTRVDLPFGKFSADEARARLVQLSGAILVEEGRFSPGAPNLEYRAKGAVVEVELMRDESYRFAVSLKARYTLCHPAQADAYYVEVVTELALAFDGSSIEIADDVPDGMPVNFAAPTSQDAIRKSVLAGILLKREDWRRSGGEMEKSATCLEALRLLVEHRPGQQ